MSISMKGYAKLKTRKGSTNCTHTQHLPIVFVIKDETF